MQHSFYLDTVSCLVDDDFSHDEERWYARRRRADAIAVSLRAFRTHRKINIHLDLQLYALPEWHYGQGAIPTHSRCSTHASGSDPRNVLNVNPSGSRPEIIASTISGARSVRRNNRWT